METFFNYLKLILCMSFLNIKKAQGTLEYLLILGAIVTVSLVVITLFLSVFSGATQSPTLTSAQSKQYQSTQTIALTDAIVDANGDAIFVLTNNSDYTIRLTGYKIDENTFNIAEDKITFNPREQKTIFFPEIGKCNSTKTCAYNKILFYYSPMNETQIFTSGGEALILGKKDNVAWNFTGTNNVVCVAQGEVLQSCSAGSSGSDTNTQTAGWTNSSGTWLSNFNVGGNAYITGNVGIGTTNPAGKLDVNGVSLTISNNNTVVDKATTNLIISPDNGTISGDVPVPSKKYSSYSTGYGVHGRSVTSTAATGKTFTFSVWMRSTTTPASTYLMYVYTGVGGDGGWQSFGSGSLTNQWQRYSGTRSGLTGTITQILIYRANSLGTIDIVGPQLEEQSSATSFVDGTRGTGEIRAYGNAIITGNVGIGTTSPGQHLEVSGTGNQFIQVNSTDNGTTGFRFLRNPTGYDTEFRNEAGVMYIATSLDNFSTTNNRFVATYDGDVGLGGNITTGTTLTGAKMVIKSTGNVGIGTTAPATKLDVNGVATIRSGGSANRAVCWKSDGKTLGYCSSVVAADGSCTCN